MGQVERLADILGDRLAAKIRTMPSSNGMPQPGPDDCGGSCAAPDACGTSGLVRTGLRERRRCERWETWHRQARLHALAERSRLSKRFRLRTFDAFQPTQGTDWALSSCRKWAEEYAGAESSDGQGLALVGQTGTGKTHLAAAIVNRLLDRGVAAVFASVPDLLADLRAAVRDGREAEQVMGDLQAAEVLVLDDIGAERPTEWGQEQLYRLVNRRYEDLRPIVLTSNLRPPDLREQVGARAVSRLCEVCAWLELKGVDYRLARGRAGP